MVPGAILGRMVLCVILGLILISFRKVWILRREGPLAFALFSISFLYLFSMMQL